MTEGDPAAKHHSWAELYFDLVFVFAVGQLAHLITTKPGWGSVVEALGLFVTLWWTWIGFVVLYNRHGEDRPAQRLFLLAGTIPCAFAAVEIHSAATGRLEGFALALAGTRLLLALAYPLSSGEGHRVSRRAGAGYALSTVLFIVSAALPIPWRYLLWAVTLVHEAGFLLLADQRWRRGRTVIARPADQTLVVNAGHLSERFNLFMIIMFGELVISLSSAAADVSTRHSGYWLGLTAGLVLAGALWWIYFDFAANVNHYLLLASGGNPALAYAIYAGGYLAPTFALLLVAAGGGLALQETPPAAAVWLVTLGLASYLAGIRGFDGRRRRRRYLLQLLVVAATVSIALLNLLLVGPVVVAVAAVWAVGVAAAMSRHRPQTLQRVMRAGAAATAERT